MDWLELLVDKPPHRDKVSSIEGDIPLVYRQTKIVNSTHALS